MKAITLLSLTILLCGCATKSKIVERGHPAIPRLSEYRRLEARLSRVEDALFDTTRDTHVHLIGMVKSAGVFDIRRKREYTLDDLIEDSYGFEAVAAVRRVRVIRNSNQPEKTKSYEVDMSEEGRHRGNGRFILEAGDVIFVPEKLGI